MEVRSKYRKGFWVLEAISLCLAIFIIYCCCILAFENGELNRKSYLFWASGFVLLSTVYYTYNILSFRYIKVKITDERIEVTQLIYKKTEYIYYNEITNYKAPGEGVFNLHLTGDRVFRLTKNQFKNYYELRQVILNNIK